MRRSVERFNGTVDFGVLTVREDELEPMARRCREIAIRELILEGRQDYLLFDVALGGSNPYDLIYRLALARVTQQGSPYSQQRAHNMIEDLDPNWLMLVGIAGATPSDEFTLGDVAVASELRDFSVRAAVFSKEAAYRAGGGAMAPAVDAFIGLLAGRQHELGEWNTLAAIGLPSPPVAAKGAKAVYGDKGWRQKVRAAMSQHFPTPETTRKPQITVRPFAGGNALMKDDALWQEWQSHARQIEAVEMELAGMYVAASTRRRQYPILVSKGISDVVGFKRNAAWTRYACETAAAGALALLRLRPIRPREKPDLAPIQALRVAEIGVTQAARYPAATVGMRIRNSSNRPIRIIGVKVKTLQQVRTVDTAATAVDNVPGEWKVNQIETEVGKVLTIAQDVVLQAELSSGISTNLVNRNIRREAFGIRLLFGLSLFRLAVSLVMEDELEFTVGTVVANLHAGNPSGVIYDIVDLEWSDYNRKVDRRMLRDCLEDRFIIDDGVKAEIRKFLVRVGDLV